MSDVVACHTEPKIIKGKQTWVLIGPPNSGKSSVFNKLTGLHQKASNFPGVTVDVVTGSLKGSKNIVLSDLPGTYSLKGQGEEVRVVRQTLESLNPAGVVFILPADRLESGLLLLEELRDLYDGKIIIALTMVDLARKKGIHVDQASLEKMLGIPVVQVHGRTGAGINNLQRKIIFENLPVVCKHCPWAPFEIASQVATRHAGSQHTRLTLLLDNIMLHPVMGYSIMFFVLFVIFQAVFVFAEPLMIFVENLVLQVHLFVENTWGRNLITRFIGDGLLTGIGSVLVFVPQIAILFFLITLLEDTGYLSRMSVLSDSLFRKLGMEGLSIVPLLSGFACAVPAIMSTRIIRSKRRRLITMFVTPLTSCSARLPVYLLIVGILIPNVYVGPIQLQGLVLFGIYMISIISVLLSAWIVNKVVPEDGDNQSVGSIIELPDYQIPSLRNALYSTWLKVLIFIKGVTKIIVVMTILLWVLGNISIEQFSSFSDGKIEYVEPASVEESLLGQVGKAIQPVFEPIGYDWKITVGVLSSFAAREVFVSTMASLYGLMDESAIEHLHDFLAHDEAITTPVLLSLLVFYIFAMLCMSTLAIMKHEAGWKMVLWEVGYTWFLAYLFAFIVYNMSSNLLI